MAFSFEKGNIYFFRKKYFKFNRNLYKGGRDGTCLSMNTFSYMTINSYEKIHMDFSCC